MLDLPQSDAPAARVAKPSPWTPARVETALIIVGLIAMFALLQHGIYADGLVRYDMLAALLQHGRLTTAKYSLVGPLFSTPLWYLGQVIETPAWWLSRYNVLVLAGGLAAIYWILRDRVDRSLLRTFFLLLIVASMFTYHVQDYYAEVFTAICVGVGLLAAVVGPSLPGWIAVVLGVVNTPGTALGLAVVVVKRILDTRRLRFLLVIAAALALIGAESWLRRGAPTQSNYEPGFTYSLFFGIIQDLFSFGAGILFFAPGLLLPIKSRLHALRQQGMRTDLFNVYVLWLLFLLGLLVVYARWYDWSGGWYWGPRFFLFASIPASFALAVRLHQRDASLLANVFTLSVLLLSCWVGLNGAIFRTTSLDVGFHGYICHPLLAWQDNLCYDAPELSVLWQPFIVASELHWNIKAFLTVEHLGVRDFLFALFSLFVFAYLALPLVSRTAQQLRDYVVSYTRAYWRKFAF